MILHTKSSLSSRRLGSLIGSGKSPDARAQTAGFTMIELSLVLLIAVVISVMAIPVVSAAINQYRLRSAVANATWAIQSTRFQALEESYPFQVTIAGNANGQNPSYQIASEPPGSGSFSNVGTPIPLSAQTVVISEPTVVQFKPNGTVTVTQNGTTATSFQITYQGYSNTVTVSNYGNVSITSP
jgi:prepilin-type N-terminal cleavage/methylation domain-containing protein